MYCNQFLHGTRLDKMMHGQDCNGDYQLIHTAKTLQNLQETKHGRREMVEFSEFKSDCKYV